MKNKTDFAFLLVRIIIAWRLIGGTWPYIFNRKPVTEVINYFAFLHLPIPATAAYISLYVQFTGGVLILLGIFVNPVSLVIAFNFLVAIIAAHLTDPIEKSFPAFILLVVTLLLYTTGGGKYSLDKLFKSRYK